MSIKFIFLRANNISRGSIVSLLDKNHEKPDELAGG